MTFENIEQAVVINNLFDFNQLRRDAISSSFPISLNYFFI